MPSPWYRNGLCFECQRCRGCCRGEPGYVWVSKAETAALAAALGRDAEDFRREYCRKAGGRTSLRERPDGDCILIRNANDAYRQRVTATPKPSAELPPNVEPGSKLAQMLIDSAKNDDDPWGEKT